MNRFYTLVCAVAALLLLAPDAQAQYQYRGPGSRGPASLEIGYSYLFASATFRYNARTFNESTGVFNDSSSTEKIHSKGGYGAMLGYSWPVVQLGDNSRMAISAAFMYDAILWESGGFTYSSNSQTGTTSSGSGTLEMGLPVGVDYKFGCDGLRDKSRKFCATIGTGAYPSIALTVYKGDAQSDFRVLPYLKGEVGVFGGICFKLRGQYTFGNIKYIDYGSETNYGSTITSLKGKSTFSLSLVLMPFSWKWQRRHWWSH